MSRLINTGFTIDEQVSRAFLKGLTGTGALKNFDVVRFSKIS
uniref:Uncharacterized protein n=1 Tax=Utricularia reniformis TaxID=192314 RepID=A0A1Y0AZP0_9LAMI|nr:hypothetical protein AEK19_MT0326 [Utricularia reniformis]ART30599.1 hypothetical protein AEK19_MT0326 [Utricularia reniformis]